MKIRICLISALWLLLNVQPAVASLQLSSAEKGRDQERVRFFRELTGEVSKLHVELKDPELVKLLDGFTKQLVLAAPSSTGERGELLFRYLRPAHGNPIALILSVSGDKTVSSVWKDILAEPSLIECVPPKGFVLIKTQPKCSLRYLALLVLQSAYLFDRYTVHPEEVRQSGIALLLRRDAQLMMKRASEALPSQEIFTQCVQREVRRIRLALSQSGGSFDDTIIGPPKIDDPDLDKVWGRPESEEERSIRRIDVWQAAYLNLAQQAWGSPTSSDWKTGTLLLFAEFSRLLHV